MSELSVFAKLNGINVNGHTEKKNGLTYLSWAWAWAEVKKAFPDATYTIYENKDGWNYFTDGKTCWVKTGVTINGLEHIEYLPVMDFKNRSIPADGVTSFDVNKAIQRSLTKACARHGLGLYIYAGEDLPEGDDEPEKPEKPARFVPAYDARGAVKAYCEQSGMSAAEFAKLRSLLVESGAVQMKSYDNMNEEETMSLIRAIEQNRKAS